MNELELNHNQNVIAAWHSICDWCKENLADRIPGGMVAAFPFQTFGWKRFAVTEEGDVQLHTGSHGDSSTKVYIREFAMEFVFSACCGSNHHSYFFDHSKKPYHTDRQIFEKCKSSEKLTASSRRINLGSIEEAIKCWPRLKEDLLLQVKSEKDLSSFKA